MIRQSISPMSINRMNSDHKQQMGGGSQYRHSSNERMPNRGSEERVNDYPQVKKEITTISPMESQTRTQTLAHHAHKSDTEIPSFRQSNN